MGYPNCHEADGALPQAPKVRTHARPRLAPVRHRALPRQPTHREKAPKVATQSRLLGFAPRAVTNESVPDAFLGDREHGLRLGQVRAVDQAGDPLAPL